MNKNNKLGKGLSALLGEKKITLSDKIFDLDLSSEKIQQLDINLLSPNKYQPRKYFNENELEELSISIKKYGILQPLVVRKISDNSYEIIAGERRYRASKLIGLNTIPVIIKDFEDKDVLSLAIIENVQRSDLSSIEEAEAYNLLIKNFNYSQQDVANFVGKSRPYVANLIRLLSLPDEIKVMICEKKIDVGHARALINKENAVELANRIINEGLTVREIESIVKKNKEKTFKKNSNILSTEDKNYIKDIEKNIFNKINLKSKIEFNSKNNKGKITITYNSLKELETFVNKL